MTMLGRHWHTVVDFVWSTLGQLFFCSSAERWANRQAQRLASWQNLRWTYILTLGQRNANTCMLDQRSTDEQKYIGLKQFASVGPSKDACVGPTGQVTTLNQREYIQVFLIQHFTNNTYFCLQEFGLNNNTKTLNLYF